MTDHQEDAIEQPSARAKKRRPPIRLEWSAPIPRSVVEGEYPDVEDDDTFRNPRRTPRRDLDLSTPQLLEASMAEPEFSDYVGSISDLVAPLEDRPGRKSGVGPVTLAIVIILQRQLGSQRAAIRELGDKWLWRRLRRHCRRLGLPLPSRASPSRDAIQRLVKAIGPAHLDAVTRDLFEHHRDRAVTILERSTNGLNDPLPGDHIVGDVTKVKPKTSFTREQSIDPETGLIYRQFDRTAERGRTAWQLTVARNLEPNERVILEIEQLIESGDECSVWAETALRLRGVYGFDHGIYDGALRGRHMNTMAQGGMVGTSKVHRDDGDLLDQWPDGFYTAKLTNGEARQLLIRSLNGMPGWWTPDDEFFVPLSVDAKLERRPGTIYRVASLPNHPVVDPSLRGARVRVRTNDRHGESTGRAEHIRALPEGTPGHDEAWRLRQDVESANRLLKSTMRGKRLRTLDPHLNSIDMLIWAYQNNVKAMVAHRQRLAADPPMAA